MNALLKNSARLLSANVIAQVIGLLVYPILTRLYTPEDFGLLNLFLSIGGILTLLANAEWHYAIVIPEREADAKTIVTIGIRTMLIVVGVVILSLPFSGCISSVFKSPDLRNWYWLMPLYICLSATWNILNYWYIRQKQYQRLSGYQYSLSACSALSKLGFGFAGCLRGGLILSMIIGPLLALIANISLGWQTLKVLFQTRTTRAEIQTTARQYKNFPLFNLPRTFINYFIGQLPVLLLTPMFGEANVGYWGMAVLLGFSPIAMINKSFYQVLYQHITERVHQHQPIQQLFATFICIALVLIVIGGGLLYRIMPDLVTWLLGQQWQPTADILRWMLPWVGCSVLAGSCSFIFDTFARQKQGLYAEILLAVCRCIGLAIGIMHQSFMDAIIGYSLGSAVAVAIQFIWMMLIVKQYERTLTH